MSKKSGWYKLYHEKVITDRYGQVRDCSIKDSQFRTAFFSQFYGRPYVSEKRNIERKVQTFKNKLS